MSEKLTLIEYASEFFQNRKYFKIRTIILPVILLLSVFSAGCKKDNFKGEVKGICPVVVSTDPMDKAVDVVLNKVISVTFNTAMNPATINNASFTIKQGAIAVSGTIAATANAAVFTFTPTAALLPFTVYTGTITIAAKDTFRTSLVSNYVWTFTTIPQVTLSSNPVAGGTTSGAGTFAQSSVVAVGATANAGFTFTNWTNNGTIVSTSSSYQFTMAGNSTLVANFAPVSPGNFSINLSSNPLAGGTTTGSGSHTAGSSATVTASPNAGYAFINWTESGVIVSASSSYSFMLNANRTLVANFKLITGSQFAVILSSNPVGGGTTAGSGLYNAGSSITVTANPNIGYTFINWTDNGVIASTSSSYTFALNANRTLVANFSLVAGIGPGPINLGTAGDFSILTKSGISTTGVTSVGGNIGVSPASSTAITGFGLIMDASGQFSHTPIVTGSVFAADYSAPTPAKMTTAVNDMQTAFTTANGLVTPAPIVDLYAGDISGRILPPGLYKWGTGVLISNAGVTLTGGPNDTWVFQIAQDLTVNNGAIVTLLGGAQAKNIFWVVTGQATLGSNVDFSGNILSKTLISLNTGAKVTGKLLAQTAVTLNASTVVQP
ncbi:MAG: cell wall/surface repeat protein [Mucilaginibacter sp.]|nr:cell wall/surface repeat protein [Mucilaginibacter sp.]